MAGSLSMWCTRTLMRGTRVLVPYDQWVAPFHAGLFTEVRSDGRPVELYAAGYERQPVTRHERSVVLKFSPKSGRHEIIGAVLFDGRERPVAFVIGERSPVVILGGDTLTFRVDLI